MKTRIFLTSMVAVLMACPAFATGSVTIGENTYNPAILPNTAGENCSGDAIYNISGAEGQNTVYYTALWEANQYNVTYLPGTKGTLASGMGTDTATFAADYTLKGLGTTAGTSGVTANPGYHFTGWLGESIASGESDSIPADSTYNSQSAANRTYTETQTLNPYNIVGALQLTAQWAADNYNVSYVADAHSTCGDSQNNCVYQNDATFGSDYEIRSAGADGITRQSGITPNTGYHFVKWNGSSNYANYSAPANGYTDHETISQYDIVGNLTLTIVTAPNQYQITYQPGTAGSHTADYVTNSTSATSVDYKETNVALAANGFTAVGYHFTGWKSAVDLVTNTPTTNPYTVYGSASAGQNADWTPGSITQYNVPGDSELTATWAANTYSVEYVCGLCGGEVESDIVTFDVIYSGFKNAATSCTARGRTTTDWTCVRTDNNTDVSHTAGDPWTIPSSVRCTAVCGVNTIYLDWSALDGGSMSNGNNPATCMYGDTYNSSTQTGGMSILHDPTRQGYTFKGWAISDHQ